MLRWLYMALALVAGLGNPRPIGPSPRNVSDQQADFSFAIHTKQSPTSAVATSRVNSGVPTAKQNPVRHPAAPVAEQPMPFVSVPSNLSTPTAENNALIASSAFVVRPRGRAPPLSA